MKQKSRHPHKTLLTPDRRNANRGASEHPPTLIADANRGTAQQGSRAARGQTRDKARSKKFQVLNICTYNVRTLNDEHLANLEVELENGFKWDIIGLAETKLKGCFKEKLSHGHLLFNSGVPESSRKFAGVGFIINKQHEENIMQFKGISERLCFLKMKGKFNNRVYIQCYAPTSTYSDDIVESFYNALQDLVDSTSNRDDLFIIGDFNAKVGGIHHLYPEVV